MSNTMARLLMAIKEGGKSFAKSPAGPSIREASEQASEVGLGRRVMAEPGVDSPTVTLGDENLPAVIEKKPAQPTGEATFIPAGKEATDDIGKATDDPNARPEAEPVTPQDAAEVLDTVGRSAPDPETQVSNTNFDRIDSDEALEAMWEKSAQQIGDEAHGPRMSHDEMIAKAKKAGKGDDVLGWLLKASEDGKVDMNTLPGQMIMARETAVEAGEMLYKQADSIVEMKARGEQVPDEVLFSFQKNIAQFQMIQEAVGKMTRMSGQLLGSFNRVAKNKSHIRYAQITEIIDITGGVEVVMQRAQNISEAGRLGGGKLSDLSHIVGEGKWVRGVKMLDSFRYNNMLSGFKTALRNTFGNIGHAANLLSVEAGGAVIGSLRASSRAKIKRLPNPEAVLVEDFQAGIKAGVNSMFESMALGVRTWGDPSVEIGQKGKMEIRDSVSPKTSRLGRSISDANFIGKGFIEIVDLLGFSLGSRNLSSGDIVFKNFWWRHDTHMKASQVARNKGLTGADKEAYVEKMLTAPQLPRDLFESGMNSAAFGTHTQDPVWGTMGRNFLQFRNSPGPQGYAFRLAVPFARILVNIMTWSAKTITLPAHPIFSPTLRQSIKAGTKEGNEYMSKLAIYSTLFAFIGQQTTQNNITGTGRYVDARTLRQWREGGWQPMSIRRKQEDGTYKYYGYGQIQPFASVVAFMSDTTDAVNYFMHPTSGDTSSDDIIDAVGGILKSAAAGPLEAPFAKGMYDWLGVMFTEYGASKVTKNVVNQFTGPPAWLRDIENALDPDRSQTYGDGLLDDLANRFESNTPFDSRSRPPRLTVFGEKANPAQSPWSIIPVTVSKHDDIFNELNDNHIFIDNPRNHLVRVNGQQVNLLKMEDGDWAMHDYQKNLGVHRLRHLNKLLNTVNYWKAHSGDEMSGGKDSRGKLLKNALNDAKAEADVMFAKTHPGSDFWLAMRDTPIPQEEIRKPAKHAGMREREREVKFQ